MKNIIATNVKLSSTGKSLTFKVDETNWSIILENLSGYNITMPSQLEGAILKIDETKLKPKYNGWQFLRVFDIVEIIFDNEKIKEILEEKRIKNKEIEEKKENEIFDVEESESINIDEEVNYNDIYKEIDFYEIESMDSKMTSLDKLIEKSIKLTKSKYNNGVTKTNDYSYENLLKLSGEDLLPFLRGKTDEIVIKRPSQIKIPKKYKGDKKQIINYLDENRYLSFVSKTNISKYSNDLLSLPELLEQIYNKLSNSFIKLQKVARKAKEIQYETGFNPFVLAGPYIIGKTEKGTFIHAPLCYQEITVKESLNEYTISKTGNFKINTYPILKNYTEQNYAVQQIISGSTSIKDILVEFYKHRIKIMEPKVKKFHNYKRIQEFDEITNEYSNDYFELSNEVLLTLKPNDELINSDLRIIRKENNDFSIPDETFKLAKGTQESKIKKYIFELDDSKSFAISKATNNSIVIFGPPGTGKSQTISAIIGEFIKNNTSSIFVAEKATAIEVIESNLKKIDLDSFVLNMNNDSKIDFKKKFNKQLDLLLKTPFKISAKSKEYSTEWLNENIDVYNFYKEYNGDDLKEISILFSKMMKIKKFKKKINSVNDFKEYYFETKEKNDLYLKKSKYENKIKNLISLINEKKSIIKNKKDEFLLLKNGLIKWMDQNELIMSMSNEELITNIGNTTNLTEAALLICIKKPLILNRFIKKNSISLKQIIKKAKEFLKEKELVNSEVKILNKDITNTKNNKIKLEKIINSLDSKSVNLFKEINFIISDDDIKNIDKNKSALNKIYKINNKIVNKSINWDKHHKLIKKHISIIRGYVVYKAQLEFQNKCKNILFQNKIQRIKKMVESRLDSKRNTIIKLVAEFSEYMKQIFTSIMMPPEYVSAIFDTHKNQFDYAIFDEASQIRLHKALPAIHRSKKIIVAGDDKQLGPVDLFTDISTDKDEDITFEAKDGEEFDSKTLLDFAKTKYLNVSLTKHYRSKSKELIEFSNDNFYKPSGTTLDVVDSPLSRFDGRRGIVVEEIGGFWREDRTNREEAKRVIELVKEYLDKDKTIGIITFNDNQKMFIKNKLEELKEYSDRINNLDKFFIKAIKDVQGDERDVIIFSITYGKREASETYVKSFGMFSKEKINVAITRAKLRMHILKSIPSSEINARNDDYRIFKKWLNYLERLSFHEITLDEYKNDDKFLSVFEKDFYDIFTPMLNKNYIPLVNYEVGSKKIDMVIYNKNTNSFICAIELDGAKWHSSLEQMENDYNRQILLESMGWSFIRLSALEFYYNRKESAEFVLSEMNKLEKLNTH